MINEKLRNYLAENYPETILFDNPSFDNSIIGLSKDSCIIYDYDKMILEYMNDYECEESEALDFITCNTLRVIPYLDDHRPVILTKLPIILDKSLIDEEIVNE